MKNENKENGLKKAGNVINKVEKVVGGLSSIALVVILIIALTGGFDKKASELTGDAFNEVSQNESTVYTAKATTEEVTTEATTEEITTEEVTTEEVTTEVPKVDEDNIYVVGSKYNMQDNGAIDYVYGNFNIEKNKTYYNPDLTTDRISYVNIDKINDNVIMFTLLVYMYDTDATNPEGSILFQKVDDHYETPDGLTGLYLDDDSILFIKIGDNSSGIRWYIYK